MRFQSQLMGKSEFVLFFFFFLKKKLTRTMSNHQPWMLIELSIRVENAVKAIISGIDVTASGSVANGYCLEWYRKWAEKH